MKVVAIKRGFHNGSRVEVGEEFDVPEGKKGKWFVPKENYVPVVPAPAGGPTTFSQIARSQPAPPPVSLRKRQPKSEE